MKQRLKSKQRSRSGRPGVSARPEIRFVLKGAGYWLLITLGLLAVPTLTPWLCGVTARCFAFALNLLGQQPTRVKDVVYFAGDNSFQVIAECTAIFVTPIFCAAVLAAPVPWRERLFALLWGIPLLFVLNVFRLVALALIRRYWPASFDFFHEYVWQVTFGATVVLMFWLWSRHVLAKAPPAALPAR